MYILCLYNWQLCLLQLYQWTDGWTDERTDGRSDNVTSWAAHCSWKLWRNKVYLTEYTFKGLWGEWIKGEIRLTLPQLIWAELYNSNNLLNIKVSEEKASHMFVFMLNWFKTKISFISYFLQSWQQTLTEGNFE